VYAKQDKQDEAISLFEEALQLLAAYPDDAFAQRLQLEFEAQLQALQNRQPTRLRAGWLSASYH